MTLILLINVTIIFLIKEILDWSAINLTQKFKLVLSFIFTTRVFENHFFNKKKLNF